MEALKVGQLVKFGTPSSESESAERFRVVELRGPRVLVEAVGSGMAIPPTAVYLASDLVDAEA